MKILRAFAVAMLLAGILAGGPALAANGHPVLMISIDGLRPGDILQARQRGLHLPNLTAFLKDGTYATAVHNALATQTYPDHITLITGVWPRKHQVAFN